MTETASLFDTGGYNYDDVEPLPISDDQSDGLCQILYDDEYRQVMGIARALFKNQEVSDRALHATAETIELVPAFYTMWNYRFQIVKQLFGTDEAKLNAELDWLDEFTLNNPKNYQIWSYRQALLGIHPNPGFLRELPILQSMIDDDTKNYHVWSYRRWCVNFFQGFEHELPFASALISRDVYNNSAWCHRMFVLKSQFKSRPPADLITTELHYTKAKIELAPQNISSWNYLRGLYSEYLENTFDPEIIAFARSFVADVFELPQTPPQILSSYALEMLAYIYSQDLETFAKARCAYKALANTYDPIRKNFWDFKIRSLKA